MKYVVTVFRVCLSYIYIYIILYIYIYIYILSVWFLFIYVYILFGMKGNVLPTCYRAARLNAPTT